MKKYRRRRPLTLDEYRRLAELTKQMTDAASEMETILSARLTVNKIKGFEKAFGAIQRVRYWISNMADNDCPTDETDRLFHGNDWTFHSNW